MAQDDLDQDILRLIQRDGKITIEEIGKALDRSPSTIRDRIKRLEEDRIILGHSIIVDEERLDIDAEAIVLADIEPDQEAKAVSVLIAIDSVSEVMKVTGEPRIMFRIRAQNKHDLLKVLDRQIRPLGFKRMDVRLVLDRLVRYPGFV